MKIEQICEAVLSLTEEDYKLVQDEVDRLKNYSHPLRHEFTVKQNAIGELNQQSLNMIRDLQKQLERAKNIMIKVLPIALALLLSACATTQPKVITRVITPPNLLTEAVPKPQKPDPDTATQKDVAVWLVELDSALDLANFKLNAVRAWSNKANGHYRPSPSR